jgi:hypothetical protein
MEGFNFGIEGLRVLRNALKLILILKLLIQHYTAHINLHSTRDSLYPEVLIPLYAQDLSILSLVYCTTCLIQIQCSV